MFRRAFTIAAAALVPLVGGLSGATGLGAAAAGTSAPAPRPAGEGVWTQPGSDAGHDYYNPDETSLTSPYLYSMTSDWHATGPPLGLHYGTQTLPVVGGGRVYFGTVDSSVQARDAASGRLLWRALPESSAPKYMAPRTSTPIYSGGSLLVTRGGTPSPCGPCYQTFGLDPATGAVRWKVEAGVLMAAGGGTAYLLFNYCDSSGCNELRLEGRDTTTGALTMSKILWQGENDSALFGTRVVLLDRGRLYLNMPNANGGIGRLAALDARTGAVRWTGADGLQPVAVAGGTGTLLATRGTALSAVDPATGRRIWTRSDAVPTNTYTPFAVGGGRVYLRCAPSLCALDLKTGETVHRTLGPTCSTSLYVSGLTLLRGRLLASQACDADFTPRLYTISTTDGSYEEVYPVPRPEVGVVVANGHLYSTDNRTLDSFSFPPPPSRAAAAR